MLRWSARENDIDVDLAGLVDPTVASGIQGGVQLAALARASAGTDDGAAVAAVASVLGSEAAVTAACAAGAFQMTNRVVEACGVPALARQAERSAADLAELGVMGFAGASRTLRLRSSRWAKLRRRLRRKG